MTKYLTATRKKLREEVRELSVEKRKLLMEIGEAQDLLGKIAGNVHAHASYLFLRAKDLETKLK